MNISPDLKQEIHLFLRSYVGYLESVKIQDLYSTLIQKSKDISELNENVKNAVTDASAKGDNRLGETLTRLHDRIKIVFF